MRLLIKNGLVLQGSVFKLLNVVIKDGIINQLSAGKESAEEDYDQIIDAQGKYISPGFIDIHTHGAVGEDVNDTSAEGIKKIADFFASQGTTSWLMSILTDERAHVRDAIQSYNDYLETAGRLNNLVGIHLEGPFLSHEYRGSMPDHLLTDYDKEFVDEALEQSKQGIRYMTVAPEVPGVLAAIPYLNSKGIVVSIGHSGATYEVSREAIEKGAASCTHTFNAMGLFHQHFPGIMGAVLESDSIFCEAICDGKHLHPGTIRMLIKTMGIDKVVMITDSIMAAGMPDGEYKLGVNDIVVEDGDASLKKDRSIRAGSTLTTGQALKNMLEFTDFSIGEILQMLTINPARLLKIDSEVGSISVGKRANLLQLGLDGSVQRTWIDGKLAWDSTQNIEETNNLLRG